MKTKASVNYRAALGEHNCGNCGMFVRQSRKVGECRDKAGNTYVTGDIFTDDVCDKWVPKK